MKHSRFPFLVLAAALLFLYLPVIVMAVNSFNLSRFGGHWTGFTLKWYGELLRNAEIRNALGRSLELAFGSALISSLLGTLAAHALHYGKTRIQTLHRGILYLPLVVPEVLMGVSLLLFFTAWRIPLGMGTLLISHITFCVSFVALTVLGRFQDFDESLVEAARDLGAAPWTVFLRIELPILLPGILSGGLLAFALSIDDFVISAFVTGPGATTLPLHIYSMIKHSRSMPIVNALSTLLMTATFAVVCCSQFLQNARSRKLRN